MSGICKPLYVYYLNFHKKSICFKEGKKNKSSRWLAIFLKLSNLASTEPELKPRVIWDSKP